MGRKTYLSIGRPLPGRVNIVLSRATENAVENSFWHKAETTTIWAGNLPSALYFADVVSISRGLDEFFVIGGGEMYHMFLRLFNKIHLTEVMTRKRLAGDATFTFPIDRRRWDTVSEEIVPAGPHDEYPSRYRVLKRRTKRVRYIKLDEFFSEHLIKTQWVNKQLDLFEDIKRKKVPYIVPYQFKLFEEKLAA
jgi:dihydrofolate reductase